jgi:hypothetical protein
MARHEFQSNNQVIDTVLLSPSPFATVAVPNLWACYVIVFGDQARKVYERKATTKLNLMFYNERHASQKRRVAWR